MADELWEDYCDLDQFDSDLANIQEQQQQQEQEQYVQGYWEDYCDLNQFHLCVRFSA